MFLKVELLIKRACAFSNLSIVSNLPSKEVVTIFSLMKNIQEYLFFYGFAKLCGQFQIEGNYISL